LRHRVWDVEFPPRIFDESPWDAVYSAEGIVV
jgi:hypothetical protein